MSDTKISVSAGADTGTMRTLSTSTGTHPPEAWAAVTADTILDLIEIAPTGSPDTIKVMAFKQELRPKLLVRFAEHYRMLQLVERTSVVKKKPGDPLEPEVVSITNDFVRLMQHAPTMIAQHFARPDIRRFIYQIIGQHSADVMHIERLYLADKTGD